MEVQQLMACPVCTLYLREGMSMQSHLNTHPKDQVIDALVRLYTTERGVQASFTQQPSPILNPFMMLSEEQIVMGRQQVTSILHPQVMSYQIYQQQNFLSTNSEYLNEENNCERPQPIATNTETPTVTTIINVPGQDGFEERQHDITPMIENSVIISPEAELDNDRTVGKTEVYIVEPGNASPLSPASNHSGLTIRTDLTNGDRNEPINENICDQYITSDCDYQDEDARHSEDILQMENEDPIGFCEDDIGKDNNNAHSCSGLNIQADERMPARGELSGQESLGNTNSSVWVPEENQVGPVSNSGWNEKPKVKTNEGLARTFQCLYCSEQFPCPKERRLHIASHHTSTDNKKAITKEAVCTKCGLQLPSMKELKVHTAAEHKMPHSRMCGVCHEVFSTKESYTEHLTKVHPLECTTCGKTFHSKSGLTMHGKIHLKVKPHPCTVCTKTFVTNQKLREHMNSHTGFAPLQCSMCDRKFKRYSNLKQHKDVAHFKVKRKTKEFFCECGEAFTSKKKLAWHEETHLEKPRQCMYCSERYIHNASLTRHIRRAHDENYLPPGEGVKPRNVECPMCAQVCVESSLRAHMKQHTVAKQFACVICGKKFHTKWNLHLHRWTHASRISKPYKCNQCKGAFIRLSEFQAHIRSHFGQKPFTCNHCGMQFNHKHNWQRHEKEHTGPKRYVCTECGKSFHRSYYLIEHVRIHTGAKPFSCHICNKTSATKSNHNKHLRTHHAREAVNTEG